MIIIYFFFYAVFTINLRHNFVDDKSYSKVESGKIVFDAKKNSIPSLEKNSDEISKKTIVSTMKDYIFKRRDYTKKFTENNTITPMQVFSVILFLKLELPKKKTTFN